MIMIIITINKNSLVLIKVVNLTTIRGGVGTHELNNPAQSGVQIKRKWKM